MLKLLLLSIISACTFSSEINKVITTMPSLTEMVSFLGQSDKIIGVTPYCFFPEKVKSLPKIGTALELNYEKLISLKPDLVLLPKTQDTKSYTDLKKLNIKTIFIGYERLDEIIKSLYELNDIFGSKNTKLVKEFEASFVQLPKKNKKVLIVISKEGNKNISTIRAAGVGSIYDDLINRLGYSNSIDESFSMYPVLSNEQIIGLKFDYLIRVGLEKDSVEKHDWNNFIFKEKVKYIYKDYAVVTGPRLTLLYKDLKELLND